MIGWLNSKPKVTPMRNEQPVWEGATQDRDRPAARWRQTTTTITQSSLSRNASNKSRVKRTQYWSALAAGGSAAILLAQAPLTAAEPKTLSFVPLEVSDDDCFARVEDLVLSRLAVLEELGKDEGINLNQKSSHDLLSFVRKFSVSNLPALTMRDDGSVRAFWRGRNKEELAVHFSNVGFLNLAIKIPRSDGSVGQWSGQDTEDGLVDALYGFDIVDILT